MRDAEQKVLEGAILVAFPTPTPGNVVSIPISV